MTRVMSLEREHRGRYKYPELVRYCRHYGPPTGYPYANRLYKETVEQFRQLEGGTAVEWDTDTSFTMDGEPYRICADSACIDIISGRQPERVRRAMEILQKGGGGCPSSG